MIDLEVTERLKAIMKRYYLTIADVADEAEVVFTTAKKIVNGVSVSARSMRKIVEVIKKYEQQL